MQEKKITMLFKIILKLKRLHNYLRIINIFKLIKDFSKLGKGTSNFLIDRLFFASPTTSTTTKINILQVIMQVWIQKQII